jgi:hypothetical protein
MDIYEKWSPIMDALKVTDEKVRKIMAEYAEFHMKQEVESRQVESQLYILPDSDVAQNLLPVSMKILARLNLTDKNVILKHRLPSITFSESIDEQQIQAIKESNSGELGMQMVIQLENILIEKLASHINKELETKDNLYITLLAQSISIISEEGNWKPRMMIRSRIQID